LQIRKSSSGSKFRAALLTFPSTWGVPLKKVNRSPASIQRTSNYASVKPTLHCNRRASDSDYRQTPRIPASILKARQSRSKHRLRWTLRDLVWIGQSNCLTKDCCRKRTSIPRTLLIKSPRQNTRTRSKRFEIGRLFLRNVDRSWRSHGS